ncbi:MAG: hypothetical protein KGD59_05065 [Candidatus Heimdallarchaeota archaeon]|nr:hypothetical protein [Candidatus Heimdallarchaeota archaeon]MBY8993899.1 hypothetical protein [Candidatus Heimdallarchaeota archaeon]
MKKGLAITLIIVVVGASLLFGFVWGNDFQFTNNPKPITPIVDGIIEKNEWKRAAYYNIPFYLDVDNTIDPFEGKQNVDGWNYLSVGEDEENYYIALDLCSDRTNNKSEEWISFFLANRMPEIMGSRLAFQALVDYGFEYLYYDINQSTTFDYSLGTGIIPMTYNYIPIVPEYDSIEIINGNTSSNYLDFWNSYDGKSFTIESFNTDPAGTWEPGDYIDIRFGVNITEKFPEQNITTFLTDLLDLKLNYVMSANLTALNSDHLTYAERFACGVVEHDGMPGNFTDEATFTSDMNNINLSNDTITSGNVDLDHSGVNASNGMFYFTIHCWNEVNATYPTAYELNIDYLALRMRTTPLITLIENTISQGNYDLAWSYGSSVKCIEDHRMFEFKIAKSEFPDLNDDMLYLFVAGYGTMSFIGTNFWAYPGDSNDNPFNGFVDEYSNFLAFDMSIT